MRHIALSVVALALSIVALVFLLPSIVFAPGDRADEVHRHEG